MTFDIQQKSIPKKIEPKISFSYLFLNYSTKKNLLLSKREEKRQILLKNF